MKPILKWVGGKRQLLPILLNNIPDQFNTYHEAFFGGGAMLFAIQPHVARVNDLNTELINVYEVVRDNVFELIDLLEQHSYYNNRDYFYNIREWDRDLELFNNLNEVQRAARIIYLNKTCFNGLYRVNSNGQFNVPYGIYVNPKINDEENLLQVNDYFNNAVIEICNQDYSYFLNAANQGDFVYLDPPYHPVSTTSSFTSYQADGFGVNEQIRLRDYCLELHQRGVMFMLSNSDTEFIRELYDYPEFEILEVQASRNINSKPKGRGKISEVIIKNY